MFPRTEILDVVVENGRAAGIVARDLVTGGDPVGTPRTPVILATGGYGQRVLPLDEREGCNVTATYPRTSAAPGSRTRASRRSPTCIPVSGDYQSKLTR